MRPAPNRKLWETTLRPAFLKTLGALAPAGALAAPSASAQVAPGGDSVTSDDVTHVGKFPLLGDGVGGRDVGDQRRMGIWRWDGTSKPGPADRLRRRWRARRWWRRTGAEPGLSLTVGKPSGSAKRAVKVTIACSRARLRPVG